MHAAVLVSQMTALAAPQRGGDVVDATAGAGGHTAALLAEGAARVLSLDVDPVAARVLRSRFADEPRVQVAVGSFRALSSITTQHGFDDVLAVIFDLGFSSDQLEDPERGLSFRRDGPIDMRLDATTGQPAAQLVNHLPEVELADLIFRYGEERRSRRIARRIVQRRPIESTTELAAIVAGAVPGRHRIHPATRTFQALRIATNDELGALDEGLDAALSITRDGGRVIVIAFHSLEDRIVKTRFRAWARDEAAEILTRRPLRPSAEEVAKNRRSRSARLRAVEVRKPH